jgi:hypothetical protein
MKIKAILVANHSTPDRSGNVYWFFKWTETETGLSVEGEVCGDRSNIADIVKEMGLKAEECFFITRSVPAKEFHRYVKKISYAGCRKEELAAFINRELAKQLNSNL